ncbi:MAG TPA: flagellar motor switch protein FliM [Pirellulales bacterium]
MSDDVLSQAEVESLLNQMESASAAAAATPIAAARPSANGPSPSREKVIPYDFKRPERVGKEQMRALQTLHEGFSRNFGAALSGLLRSIIEVKLTSVDQLTYSEFVFSLENPTCFNLLKAEPLEGNLILDINPSILYPIIDRLLGGGRDQTPPARRPLTEIELRLVARITSLFLEEFRRAWVNVVELKMAVERVESNPQLVQIVPPNEVIVLISFEISLGDTRGMMNLCIPFNSIERIGQKLSSNSWVSYGRRGATAESTERISKNLRGALVQLVAQLAETKITTGDLIGLRVGDIITTEKDVNTPIVISVEGQAKYHARPGALKGRKAIRIDEALATTARPKIAVETKPATPAETPKPAVPVKKK